MGVRINLVANKDRGKRTIVVIETPLKLDQLQKASKNKLRLKATRFFADGGQELENGVPVQQDQVVLCSAGEDYVAPGYEVEGFTPMTEAAESNLQGGPDEALAPPPLTGVDDRGDRFESLSAFWCAQVRETWYRVNEVFWDEVGANSKRDAFDDDSEVDVYMSKVFLDELCSEGVMPSRDGGRGKQSGQGQAKRALDLGAGTGRVTKDLLLKYVDEVHLVDGCDNLLLRSRRSLGKKLCAQCHFYLFRLEGSAEKVPFPIDGRFDIVWIQLVLQYLTDDDAVAVLRRCGHAVERSGVVIVKENHAEGLRKAGDDLEQNDMFFVATPSGANQCYSITRSDAHHRWLFQRAGLAVVRQSWGDELVTYGLQIT